MIEVNLIPDVKLELIKARRARAKVVSICITICVVSFGVVAVLCAYIFGVQTVRNVLADNTITSQYQELKKVDDLSKILTIQNQLSKISTLNDNKKVYSRTFDMLSAIVPSSPNQVQISSLNIDANKKTITIEGQAANSYAALEVFKKMIHGAQVQYNDNENKQQKVDLASNISTSDTSYGEDSSGNKVLRFTLSFDYAQELFSPSSDNVSVLISTNGNVTDSYLGVPTSIFTTRATDITGGQQ